MSLHKTQTAFKEMILTGNMDTPEQIFRTGGASLNKRLSTYKNNYRAGLSSVLSETYQTITALVGEKFMYEMSKAYALTHPPQKACLHTYGEDFPSFIADFEPACALPYLSDSARLDWAANRAYHAPDREALSFKTLDHINLEDENLTLKLHPSVSLLHAPFPIADIRHYVRNEEQQEQKNFKMNKKETYLLISRQDYSVYIQDLTPADYHFLSHTLPLMESLEATLEAFPHFDFQTCLQKTLACETFLAR